MNDFLTSAEEEWLVDALRRGLSDSDPAPSDVTDFAKAAFSWRAVDAELAELDFDSVDEDMPAGVRSSATARMISFQSGPWTLDVEFDSASSRLMGAISPQVAYSIDMHTAAGLFTVDSDEVGRFEFEGLASGPLSLVLRLAGGTVIKTRWVIL